MTRRSSLLALLTAGLVTAGGLVGSGSASGPAAAGFDPLSVTFVSPRDGWVLGLGSCPRADGRCLELSRTVDSGRSWSSKPLPASLVEAADRRVEGRPAVAYPGMGLNVRFADRSDGWVYGQVAAAGPSGITGVPHLWVTHDGGRLWRRLRPSWLGRQASILDLEAGAGRVHLMAISGTRVVVFSSPVRSENWRRSTTVPLGLPAGGTELVGAFVLAGSSGWLVEGNDRGTIGSARLSHGRWVRWVPPCASVGGSFATPAASTPSNLVAECVMGGYASPLPPTAPKGATLGSTWLYFSHDGGATFRPGPEIGQRGVFFSGVLASPRPAAVLIERPTAGGRQQLQASFDAGKDWTTVYRGGLSFLGFTTPDQGVAIAQLPDGRHRMIMSFDGGRHWATVDV